MENHHIVARPVNEASNVNSPMTYICKKCGKDFGTMSFEASQFLNIMGCPGMKIITEPVPSPFWVNGEVSNGDPGHDGLIKDIQMLMTEADQYRFHDFKSKKYPMPKVALISWLEDIINRAKGGYYDNKI